MKSNASLHFLKYIFGMTQAVTQTTEKERNAIASYATNSGKAIEIGVFEGVNTAVIARAMRPDGRVYGIDPFFKGRLGLCYYKYIALLNIRRNGMARKVTLVEKFSSDAAGGLPEVDFIFIDGDHSYEGVKKDWELYSQKLRPGGIMALHDTTVPEFDPGRITLGSIQFFNDTIKKDERFDILETVDSLNILRRK